MQFKTFGQIVSEMVSYLAGTASQLTDTNIGSATLSFLEAMALALAEVHYLLQQMLLRFFVATATGQWLDMRAGEFGLTRIAAAPTTVNILVGHNVVPAPTDVTIPAGQQFRTLPGATVQVTYTVTSTTVFSHLVASVNVPCVSTAAGAFTNLPATTPLQQVGVALPYLDTIAVGTLITAGVDLETDDLLRARVLLKMRNPAGPGNQADYVSWAKAAPGGLVASASVLPIWNGFGTVKVLVLGANNSVPSSGEIAAVQAYIDPSPQNTGAGLAPVGALVTVAAPALNAIDVQVTVTAGAGFDPTTVKANVTTAIQEYLDALAIGATSQIAAIGDAIWRTAGVGGPTGTDGGNYTLLQQRLLPGAWVTTDIATASGNKVTAGGVYVS